jgi:hypothetical protein
MYRHGFLEIGEELAKVRIFNLLKNSDILTIKILLGVWPGNS